MSKTELITTLCSHIPLSWGFTLRQLAYRHIFGEFGQHVQIHPGVEFQVPAFIKLGDSVTIRQGASIRRIGGNSSIHIHSNVSLDSGVNLRTYHDSSLIIGEHTVIGPYTCISGGNVTIGNDCMIASHVSIYANNHNFADPNEKIRNQSSRCKGVTIGDDCWLGTGARVVDGVTIGQGSVIGAGAVVTKSIPEYAIAVGVPAKVIGQRGTPATEAPQTS
ncbi:MAG: DapH/DapD/GlmU-related protein [Leptolyngbyaceae cyanobacterium]